MLIDVTDWNENTMQLLEERWSLKMTIKLSYHTLEYEIKIRKYKNSLKPHTSVFLDRLIEYYTALKQGKRASANYQSYQLTTG